MSASPEEMRDIAVPGSLLATLRLELEREVGALPAIHVLHSAGYAVGAAAAAGFREGVADVGSLPEDVFWARMSGFFAQRGWGSLSHRDAGDAVGLLVSDDWAEVVEESQQDDDASCSFSAGFLGGLLSELAGGPIAVLEVSCRGRGDEACTFAFGSEDAVHHLYGRLLDGSDLDHALEGF